MGVPPNGGFMMENPFINVSKVMGVSLYHWMAYFMENPLKTEDDWEYPYFRTPPLMT